MTSSKRLKISGLKTSTNELLGSDGALTTADNVNISNKNLISIRKGFEKVVGEYSDANDRTDALTIYKDTIFSHHGSFLSADTLSYLDSGNWTSVGSYSSPTNNRMRFLESNSNLYFTTSSGVIKLDSIGGSASLAGVPKAINITGAISGSGTALTNNKQVAYRVVWFITDSNDNLILGSPSQRITVANTSGSTQDVDITISIPEGITTSHGYQVYKTSEYDTSVTPNEEFQLVFEGFPTSSEITTKTVTVTDVTPSVLRGATLYTSPSQEGIAFAAERPPLAQDITSFRDCVFFSNTTSKHRKTITIISASSMANDDTITIDGVVFTAKASETIASGFFQLHTAGTESQNIENTALSLCKVINQYSSNTSTYAYYLSADNDLPGKILIEERAIGGSNFSVSSSNYTPLDISSSVTSENDDFKNGLFWSKPFEPEAVPLVNFVRVGQGDKEILRIIALEEALYIFKEEGIYRLTGYYPSFEVELMDSSTVLLGRETPAILNNQIYCLSTQGIVAVSGTDAKIISTDIENDLFNLFDTNLTNLKNMSVGLANEISRTYTLWYPPRTSATTPEKGFVFNYFTRAWTTHSKNITTGIIEGADYYLAPISEYLLKERATGTNKDFVDFNFNSTITSIDGENITISSGIDNVSVGDVLFQSDSVFSIIESIDSLTSTVTVQNNVGFTTGSVDLLSAINITVEWFKETFGQQDSNKIINQIHLFFKEDFAGSLNIDFKTDLRPNYESTSLIGTSLLGFGLAPFGEEPWGGEPGNRPLRNWLPRSKQRCNWMIVRLRHSYSYSNFKLEGISLSGSLGSSKTSR